MSKDVLDKLRRCYGVVELLEPREPFELIVWENAAYLVDDERRSSVWRALDVAVGISPVKLLAAGARRIEAAIREGGMQPAHRAAKVLRCAELALEAGGDLRAALESADEKKRRTLLKRFPGIADPGADKVLLFCGFSNAPALDSNGLRVLARLGVIEESESYAAMYRAGIGYLSDRVKGSPLEAFALLRAHGRELCKRTAPLCGACPLQSVCRYGGGTALIQ
ncbi:MAG TPA: hypothetical protein VGN11_03265 [Candidatus Baltobacteraceae bacterium]|nr:hypothetical protein [Candidatus Baltobacteraceae bacterium]